MHFWRLGLLTVAILGVVACGGSASDDTGARSAPSTTTTSSTPVEPSTTTTSLEVLIRSTEGPASVAYCTAWGSFRDRIGSEDYTPFTNATVAAIADDLGVMAANTPEELRADLETAVAATAEFRDLLGPFGYDVQAWFEARGGQGTAVEAILDDDPIVAPVVSALDAMQAPASVGPIKRYGLSRCDSPLVPPFVLGCVDGSERYVVVPKEEQGTRIDKLVEAWIEEADEPLTAEIGDGSDGVLEVAFVANDGTTVEIHLYEVAAGGFALVERSFC